VPDRPWWQTAVVYQIYPRSFDTDGDGVGDLEGVRRRLDYLADLGVDAVWLSPFYRSPMADFGYDVADHCDVDPLFGTLADFDRLLHEAHERGLQVLVDWVPNHTSDQHPWFIESRSSRGNPKRDWYVWRDGTPDTPPNNWQAAFGGDAWTWDDATGQWYLHLFLPEQPDLNWANPEVEAAMHDTLRFWLDRGVDGFRVDVVHAVGKDPDHLPDWPAGSNPSRDLDDPPHGHEIVRRLRQLVDSYDGDRVLVGEVYLMSTPRVAAYYGAGDELHLCFNFPPLYAPWDATKWRQRIDRVVEAIEPVGWPTWVLSNHDNPRHRTRYGSDARARAAAVLLLGLRGTPFLYAGEELGLEDAVVAKDREVDPGGRDGCRAPIPWDGSPAHGWPSSETWLPWPPDADRLNAEDEGRDPDSMLHLYRQLLAARRDSPALQHGEFAWLPSPDGVLAWERRAGDDRRVVVVNFTDSTQPLGLADDLVVEVATVAAEPGGKIAAHAALVLRPRH
jgi:alpha-glucosidase